jgi:hypothetical protein
MAEEHPHEVNPGETLLPQGLYLAEVLPSRPSP